MDLLNGILNGSLGEGTTSSRSGSSAPRSGGTSVITNNTPLTAEEQNARHRGASYSSSGTYERWYIDEETGRKIYTAGDKAGTWVQVQEPRQPSTRIHEQTEDTDNSKTKNATNPQAGTTAPEDEDDNTLLWIGVLTTFGLVAYKALKRKKK